jgi:hypothetical protein
LSGPAVEPLPVTAEAPPCWPPVQHIIHKRDEPAREGTIALCGAKLMGIDLGPLRNATGEVCAKCVEAFTREAQERAP